MIGTALAWRQADALRDAGIDRAYALSPLLAMIDRGDITVSRNTVLVIDEVSQVGPRPLLKLLELQARTGHDHQDARRPGASPGDRGGRQH